MRAITGIRFSELTQGRYISIAKILATRILRLAAGVSHEKTITAQSITMTDKHLNLQPFTCNVDVFKRVKHFQKGRKTIYKHFS